jgi:hypothetical protein
MLNVSNSAHGWMTSALFDKWAASFAEWICEYRAKMFPEDQNRTDLLFLGDCGTRCGVLALGRLVEI